MRKITKEEAPQPRSAAGRPSKYPWDEWLVVNEPCEILQDVDYTVPTEHMRVMVNNAARRRKGRATTQSVDSGRGLRITFVLNPETGSNAEDFEFDRNERDPRTQPLGPA